MADNKNNSRADARELFLFGLGKFCQFEVDLDLVDDGADQMVGPAVLGVVGRGDEIHSLLPEEFLRHIDFLLVFRIVDSDRVSSEHLDNLHAWHVSLSVSEIDHMRERNPLDVFGLTLVDLLVVPDRCRGREDCG